MSRFLYPLGLLLLLLLLSGCAASVGLGELTELQEGETIAIKGVGMRIRLEDIGHGWYVDGGHFPIVFVTVSYDGSTQEHQIEDGMEIGEYYIEISRVSEHERSCSIVVTKR